MLKSIPLALTAALFLGQAANAAISGSASTDLNVRAGPGSDYAVVGVLAANAPVTIGDCMQDTLWCNVNADGLQGWAFSPYLIGPDGAPLGDATAIGSTVTLSFAPAPQSASPHQYSLDSTSPDWPNSNDD